MNNNLLDQCGWVNLAGDYAVYPQLQGQQKVDWVIIGAGFTGHAAARRLAELVPEQRILLIDAKQPGQGASGRNSGFVVAHESPGHAKLTSLRDQNQYQALHTLDLAGVEQLRRWVFGQSIACQWQDVGSIHAASDSANFSILDNHVRVFEKLGIVTEQLQGNELSRRLGTSFYQRGVYCGGGALIQPAALIRGLLESLPESVECYEQSPVQKISCQGRKIHLLLPNARVIAERVIICTNAFIPKFGIHRNRMFPLALTASLTRPLRPDEEIEMGRVMPWGVLSPQPLGATVRLTPDRRLLMRNTAEYRPAGISRQLLAQRRKQHLSGLKKRFPWLDRACIDYTWSGHICISRNAKPVFGAISRGLYVAGCYNASGVARGSILGRLIVDQALDVSSELLNAANSLFRPALLPPRPFFDAGALLQMKLLRKRGASEA